MSPACNRSAAPTRKAHNLYWSQKVGSRKRISLPAGRLDAGESPEECAQRELEEETGMRAGRLERLTTIYTTPGFTDERIHLFLAMDLTTGAPGREVDEFMEVAMLRWSEVGRMIRRGEVMDAKTLSGLMFVQCFRRVR